MKQSTIRNVLSAVASTRPMVLCWSIAIAVILAGGLPEKANGQSTGASRLVAPIGKPGSDSGPAHHTPVLRFQFTGTDPLSPLSDIPPTPASAVNDPIFTAFNAQGELFVANRHGNIGGGVGSVARFTFDSAGDFFDNGTITGNSLEAVHGLAVSPDGELFASNLFNGRISRFQFDGAGNAIPNGVIISPGVNMGLAFSANGELFVTHSSPLVDRFVFDSLGTAIPNGSFMVPGASRLHGLTFNAQGELFIGDIDTANVFRVTFDNAGNPVSNGTISVPGGPIGVAFSSSGELFVSLHFSGGISRFLFDGSGNAVPNGFTPTDNLGGLAVASASPRLTDLGPAKIWLGLKNSDDVGTKLDLLAEVFKNGTPIGSGQLNNVPGGSSGFNNAVLRTINLTLPAPVDISPGDALSIKLSVRIAVGATGHRSGTARLWFNDSAANSKFSATVGGTPGDYFLLDGFTLTSAAGSGPKKTIDVFVDRAVDGNPFKPFGTWSKTF